MPTAGQSLDRRAIIDPALAPIADKVERGERALSHADGVALFASPDLLGIGHARRLRVNRAKHGDA